jgi:hypothetical protein
VLAAFVPMTDRRHAFSADHQVRPRMFSPAAGTLGSMRKTAIAC